MNGRFYTHTPLSLSLPSLSLELNSDSTLKTNNLNNSQPSWKKIFSPHTSTSDERITRTIGVRRHLSETILQDTSRREPTTRSWKKISERFISFWETTNPCSSPQLIVRLRNSRKVLTDRISRVQRHFWRNFENRTSSFEWATERTSGPRTPPRIWCGRLPPFHAGDLEEGHLHASSQNEAAPRESQRCLCWRKKNN